MARRSIGEAAKVVIAAVVLGPPLGGAALIALMQIVPWIATDFPVSVPEFSQNLFRSISIAVPLAYVVGLYSAILAGLALAAYVSWGGRLTWWSCLAASLIYPAVLAISGWFSLQGSPETLPPVMINAAIMAIASACGAVLTYLLLHRTGFVRRLNARQ
ncbi:conserved membrane protein of unknown function [Hyphomicrobium sp. 1Nfss2.1]|uniref:hypothetical protein n=1 Tax=Hyphomicrobium sp. 1Nfss2.1 TaxID=3413936 RepID=UPI003C7EB32F